IRWRRRSQSARARSHRSYGIRNRLRTNDRDTLLRRARLGPRFARTRAMNAPIARYAPRASLRSDVRNSAPRVERRRRSFLAQAPRVSRARFSERAGSRVRSARTASHVTAPPRSRVTRNDRKTTQAEAFFGCAPSAQGLLG